MVGTSNLHQQFHISQCARKQFELAEFDCIVIKTAGIQALCVVHVPVNEVVCHIFVTKKKNNKKIIR